jgi:hypothetical protein
MSSFLEAASNITHAPQGQANHYPFDSTHAGSYIEILQSPKAVVKIW